MLNILIDVYFISDDDSSVDGTQLYCGFVYLLCILIIMDRLHEMLRAHKAPQRTKL